MRVLAAILVSVLSLCTANSRTKRQAIIFGTEPRPDQATCTDYRGQLGTCLPLRSCNFWLQIVSNNPTRSDTNNLRRSICATDFSGGRQSYKICCPNNVSPPVTQRPTRPPFTPRPQTPRPQTPRPQTPRPQTPRPQTPRPNPNPSGGDPQQHRNRGLLPQDHECGTTIHDRIVGGDEADLGQYPWLALLGYQVNGGGQPEFNCGGTLINDRYVLTAAHCVTNLGSYTLTLIRLGEHDTTSNIDCQEREGIRDCAEPVQDFTPEQVISHAQYNSPNRFWNDIALIRLSRNVNKNPYVSPICMPFGEYGTKDYVGDRLWVAGFGLTQAFGDASTILMDLRVPVVSNQRCADVFRSQRAVIGNNQICAGGQQGQDSCSGDSGGPLMGLSKFGPPYRIVGVVSFGVKRCGTADVPGVYTRIGAYLNWVMDNLRA